MKDASNYKEPKIQNFLTNHFMAIEGWVFWLKYHSIQSIDQNTPQN